MQSLKKISFALIVILTANAQAQKPTINILDSGRKTSLRGLSVVDDNFIWASGSNGTVVKSTNGGKTFEWITVQGYEQRDFRDIEAFDEKTALIMAIAEPAIILKTRDGGKTWKKVFEDTTKGMFLDAMDFAEDETHGIVIGDPLNKVVFISYTNDQGNRWSSLQDSMLIDDVDEGEAFFAASGTNIVTLKNKNQIEFLYVSGGKKSRLYDIGRGYDIPIIQGAESQGANSLALMNINGFAKGVIVGGDFKSDTSVSKNCILINGVAKSKISFPQIPPHGYRSCVEYVTEDKLITCGTSGVDVSGDGGMNWELISTQSFHVCQKAKKGSKVFLAGANGTIAVLANF